MSRVEPSRTLIDPCKETQHPYTKAVATDVAALFARVRAEMEAAKRAQPSNLKQLRKAAK